MIVHLRISSILEFLYKTHLNSVCYRRSGSWFLYAVPKNISKIRIQCLQFKMDKKLLRKKLSGTELRATTNVLSFRSTLSCPTKIDVRCAAARDFKINHCL